MRLSGDGGEADGVRCSRGLGATPYDIGLPSGQDDFHVDHSAGRIELWAGWKEFSNEQFPMLRDRLKNKVLNVQWLACEEHLSGSPVHLTCDLEVEVGRAYQSWCEGVGPGLDRRKAKLAFAIGELHTITLKARIEGCRVVV
ncbi:MAG TPA: hypothetical protein VGX68_26075, partial [Thermoanaerobaculia bacterium]|nr:hypothetical protein [Thermoanaerobaculia bacterium]